MCPIILATCTCPILLSQFLTNSRLSPLVASPHQRLGSAPSLAPPLLHLSGGEAELRQSPQHPGDVVDPSLTCTQFLLAGACYYLYPDCDPSTGYQFSVTPNDCRVLDTLSAHCSVALPAYFYSNQTFADPAIFKFILYYRFDCFNESTYIVPGVTASKTAHPNLWTVAHAVHGDRYAHAQLARYIHFTIRLEGLCMSCSPF